MPIHDWMRVEAGIFHAFHHGWISTIGNALNWLTFTQERSVEKLEAEVALRRLVDLYPELATRP